MPFTCCGRRLLAFTESEHFRSLGVPVVDYEFAFALNTGSRAWFAEGYIDTVDESANTTT